MDLDTFCVVDLLREVPNVLNLAVTVRVLLVIS